MFLTHRRNKRHNFINTQKTKKNLRLLKKSKNNVLEKNYTQLELPILEGETS